MQIYNPKLIKSQPPKNIIFLATRQLNMAKKRNYWAEKVERNMRRRFVQGFGEVFETP
jgi:hypothetical protein